MKIKKIFRKLKFIIGKKEQNHIRHFLNNFGVDIDNVVSFYINADEEILYIEEAYEPK